MLQVPQNVIDLVEKCVSFRKVDFNGFSVTNLINGRSYKYVYTYEKDQIYIGDSQ